MVSQVTNEARVRRFCEDNWGRNLEYARELFAPDARVPTGIGPEAKIAAMSERFRGFSDMRVTISHLVADGDQVFIRFVVHATDRGGFVGQPATGKEVEFWGAEYFRFADGHVVDNWAGLDYLSLFMQLGVTPSPWPEQPAR